MATSTSNLQAPSNKPLNLSGVFRIMVRRRLDEIAPPGQLHRWTAHIKTMRHPWLAITFLLLNGTTALTQEQLPTFTDYPTRVIHANRSVRVQLHSTPDTVCFRTMLRKVAREGQLFAGHYAVGYWGCGTCLRLGIVDLVNGRAYVTPFEASSAQGIIRVKPNSRLLILDDAERADPSWFYLGTGRHLLDVSGGPKVARSERERKFLRCSEMTHLR